MTLRQAQGEVPGLRAHRVIVARNLRLMACLAGGTVVYLLICWLIFATRAHAHDATPTAAQPDGWKYPTACCSGIDCREVADKAIGEGSQGYTIKGTGELLSYSDTRIRNSPDGRFHWCSVQGADNSRTICLFAPPRAF